MYMFENGDRCPCCGQTLEGKSRDWLELFSQTVHALGLDPGPQFRIPEPLKLRHLTPSPFLSAAKPPADEPEITSASGSPIYGMTIFMKPV